MADSKISALPAATTPLAGTEVLPIVQSGATDQVTVANLTVGRAVSAASLALTASPLPATSGGTGSSSAFTTNGVAYASSTTVVTTGSGLQFNGTNLAIGTSPSGWGGGRSFDVGTSGALFGDGLSFDWRVGLAMNCYRSGGADSWLYKTSGQPAGIYQMKGLFHIWSIAPVNAGAAGAPVTFTDAMVLNNSGNVGIGTSSPSASAILDVQSTTKGVRMPNMTTAQKNAIASPAAGLMVFDTTLAKLCVYSGAAWQTVTSV
jgi:hypothetical protein